MWRPARAWYRKRWIRPRRAEPGAPGRVRGCRLRTPACQRNPAVRRAARLITLRAARSLWRKAAVESFGALPVGFIIGLGTVMPHPCEVSLLRFAFGFAEAATGRALPPDASTSARAVLGDFIDERRTVEPRSCEPPFPARSWLRRSGRCRTLPSDALGSFPLRRIFGSLKP